MHWQLFWRDLEHLEPISVSSWSFAEFANLTPRQIQEFRFFRQQSAWPKSALTCELVTKDNRGRQKYLQQVAGGLYKLVLETWTQHWHSGDRTKMMRTDDRALFFIPAVAIPFAYSSAVIVQKFPHWNLRRCSAIKGSKFRLLETARFFTAGFLTHWPALEPNKIRDHGLSLLWSSLV